MRAFKSSKRPGLTANSSRIFTFSVIKNNVGGALVDSTRRLGKCGRDKTDAQLLVSLGLTGKSYYILLLALGLAAAAFLFGALQYYAGYKGRNSSKMSPGPPDSFHVRNVPTNDAAIIFVHGVTGNSRETWTNDSSKGFWPEMLTEDPALNGTNIFVYGYDSPRLGQSLTFGELGENLRLMLSSNDIFKHLTGSNASRF
jgi:hypothetical protein